ncbi:cytochrome P450 [Melanogaster broomeanus]|nr:cytochrome P450 [Melanogaster broomeanus]
MLGIGRRYLRKQKHLSPYPLPPGPPGIPLIGNVTGMNQDAPWQTYSEWAKTYGDLIYTHVLGNVIIIINSEKVARDFLENRSENYSDRPYLVPSVLFGLDFILGFLPFGDRWRRHRRFLHQSFRADSVQRFVPLLQRKASHLLCRLLDKPDLLSDHVFEYSAAAIMNSVYDYNPVSRKDEMIDTAEQVLGAMVDAFRPDIGAVISIPGLIHLPSWLPGMSFKRRATLSKRLVKRNMEVPFNYSLQKMNNGSTTPSMVYDALRRAEDKGTSEDSRWMQDLKEAASTAFLGHGNQTNSVIMTFFLMMLVVPEAQEKAQAQIDEVIGKDRLPTLEDRASLPYIDAIFRETLRFSPPAPLSVPHASSNDDVYNGYLIPKEVISVRSMARNESKFPNPLAFNPDRFINDDGTLNPLDIQNFAFGFGRRVCVGRHFADAAVWSVIAKVLSVFKLLKPLDENGKEVQVEARFSNGLGVHPLPFSCRIVPRNPGMDSEKLEELIAASAL